MTQAITTTNESAAAIIERVMVAGDLSKLTPEQRAAYYMRTCESLGLNPMTRPFEYITLNGKLTMYARKDATDQLRSIRSVSIGKPDIQFEDGLIIVSVEAHDSTGRTDSDVGVVGEKDMGGNKANAIMKAITKAKRRVTLSICGLGMLDETEVEAIPGAQPFVESEPRQPEPPKQPAPEVPKAEPDADREAAKSEWAAAARKATSVGVVVDKESKYWVQKSDTAAVIREKADALQAKYDEFTTAIDAERAKDKRAAVQTYEDIRDMTSNVN